MATRAISLALLLTASAVACAPAASTARAQPAGVSGATAAPEYGPAKGTLVIVGGGNLESTGVTERFIALAGGPTAKIVIVPTAGGNRDAQGALIPYDAARVLASWRARGLTNVHMLHTHDPAVANTEAFAEVLRDAAAVWFNGGRQWNIVDSYAKTRTYDAFHAVLARGGVIGGSSAGATIQGEYLVRGAVSGSNVMMSPEPEHQDAFRFLRRSAIDQHIDTRNRWNDLAPVLAKFPNLLGIGLSEGTAIVVRGDTFEVIGRGKVAVHDNTRKRTPGDTAYITLSAADRYDMKSRQVIMQSQGRKQE
ncbi:MAG TPA: cyanophycinase [Gemmatimonas sp.]|nr:cyanophycinase [Gemmatimonas sp.]